MIEYLVAHCSATPPTMDIGEAEIREWHIARGWRTTGYNYIIRRDGSLECGREEGEELAHAKGFNRNSIAICLVGGVNADSEAEANFTLAQSVSLATLHRFLKLKYPDAKFVGHRDLGANKDCPSFSVMLWEKTMTFEQPKKLRN